MGHMKRLIIGASALLAAGFGEGHAQDAQQSITLEGIAATVNDQVITYSDVRERAQLLLLSLGVQPDQEALQQITAQALEQLIDETLQLQEAQEFELEIDAGSIARAVDRIASQAGLDRASLYDQLLSAGVNPASLEEQMRAEIAWREIMGGLYGSRIRVSKNQIEDRMQRFVDQADETQYQVSEIFLFAGDPQTRTQALQAASGLVEQLRQGAPFEAAAQQFSSSPTAAAGGNRGWVTLDTLPDEVREAIAAMPGPGVSDPIPVSNGVFIVGVRGKRDPQSMTEVLSLRQLVATNGSDADLNAAIRRTDACDDLDGVAEANSDLKAITLGEVRLDDLNETAQSLVADVEQGDRSDAFDSATGRAVMFVCERRVGGDGLPTRVQIEDRLFSEELSMISDRELRNLRLEATIIRR